MSEILLRKVASSLKIDADEWIASLKDNGGDFLPEDKIASEIVGKFAEAATAATDSAKDRSYKNGQAEMSKKFNKLIKGAGFENSDNLSGDELFEAFAAWKADAGQAPSGTPLDQLSKDELEKLPLVKQLKLDAQKAAATEFERLKKEYDSTVTTFEQYKAKVADDQVKGVIRSKLSNSLKKGNVILSVDGFDIDPQEREAAVFERLLGREKFGLDNNGNPVVLDADGSPKTDSFGKTLDFDDIVLGIAKPMFGVSTQNPAHSGSGMPQNQPGKPTGYAPKMHFGSQAEKDAYIMGESDPANRLEAEKSWQHQQQKAAGN